MIFEKGKTYTYTKIINIEFSEKLDYEVDVCLIEHGRAVVGERFLCLHIDDNIFSFVLIDATGRDYLYECVYAGQANGLIWESCRCYIG